MKCPECGSKKAKVTDSRFRDKDNVIKRRRKCENCSKRFNTYEVSEKKYYELEDNLRHYIEWQPFEEEILVKLKEDDYEFEEIAKILNRSKKAVRAHYYYIMSNGRYYDILNNFNKKVTI